MDNTDPKLVSKHKQQFFDFMADAYPELFEEIPATQKVIASKEFIVTDLFIGAYEEWSYYCFTTALTAAKQER